MISARDREEDTLATPRDQGSRRRGIALLVALLPALATAAPAQTPDGVEPLLSLALVPVRTSEWTVLSVIGSDWAAARLDADDLALLEREALHAFGSDALGAAVAADLREASAVRQEQVLRFLATPLGRRIAEVDRNHIAGERLREQPGYLSRVLLEGLQGPRWEAIRRLDAATGMTRDALATGTAMGLAIAAGAQALACLPPRGWPAAEARLAQRITALAPYVEGRVAGELGFRFQDLSTTDLARLASFAEGDGAWLYARVGDALATALVAAGRNLAERLAPEIAARCPR